MPEIKFLADMNISPLTVEGLKKAGWNAIRVSDVLNIKNTDLEILEYARENNRILITQDLDFTILLAIGGHGKPSVINIRTEVQHPEFITKRLIEVLFEMENELKDGIIASIDEYSVRYRRLPI